MYIVYFDEAGDDGHSSTASPFFVLSALYLHHLNWKEIFEQIINFRRYLKEKYNIPIKTELHSKPLLLNKRPYKKWDLSNEVRVSVMDDICKFIGSNSWESINVVINKTMITNRQYSILENALKYTVQRIENTLNRIDPSHRFLTISDKGRVGKMQKTCRKIQKVNYIPSKFNTGSFNRVISSLIEDPLPKDSRESYFIQFADCISFIVYHYANFKIGKGKENMPNRMPELVDEKKMIFWMDSIKNSLNLYASSNDPYGIVCYPRP